MSNHLKQVYELLDQLGGEFPYTNPRKIIQLKPKSSVSNEINDKIKLLSFDINNIIPFGSWVYKSQLYPGDIDLMETSYKCCSASEASKYFVKKIQGIVEKILKTRLVYLGDIKAGIDHRYKIDIGEIKYGPINRIYGYNPQKVNEELIKLYNDGLITKDELDEAREYNNNTGSIKYYENLYTFLRKKWLLRWNQNEILQGYKILRGGVKYTLEKALQDNTLTKIDIWGLIGNKFTEITNVYMLFYIDNNGNNILLNYKKDIRLLIKELTEDAQKLIYSPNFYSPFKAIKRIWSRSRILRDYRKVKIITPFMQTDVGRLSQIKSEIETLIFILGSVKSPPIKTIYKQIDGFKTRLANVYQIDFDEEMIDNIITSIINNKNKIDTINKLEYMYKYFASLIDKYSQQFLKLHRDLL